MSEKKKKQESKQTKTSTGVKVLIVGLVIVIVVAVVVIVLLLNKKQTDSVSKSGGRGVLVTKDNVDSVELNKETEDGYYNTSQSIDWHFDGKKSDDAYVANDESNSRTVYFDLNLADTGELIYSSPYIPVGSELNGVELDKKLSPGKYETIMKYHLVDDENNELSTLSVALDIYVE